MNIIEFYQIDAFTNRVFKGNPAGVCLLKEWIDEKTMQAIAFENNLSETAFYVKTNDKFEIRWFTPTTEVDLCGHATLATAFVEFEIKKNRQPEITFYSHSGDLKVSKHNDLLTLDFPVVEFYQIDLSYDLIESCDIKPTEAYIAGDDILLVFDNEESIEQMIPSLDKISQINARGVTVTAKGNSCDFVSRFFGPQSGIDEDPVTGSTHTYLTPFWSERLKKDNLQAKQLSKRGGVLHCELNGERVKISGNATLYLKGEIVL